MVMTANSLALKYEHILSLCEAGKRNGIYTQIRCPLSGNHKHGDKEKSASLGLHNEGISFKCFAGCQTDDFLKALGLTYKDLFPDDAKIPTNIYTYHNADGSYHHDKIKYRTPDGKKTFRQRTIDDNGNIVWTATAGLPFGYPRLQQAIHDDKIILYVEGEKDALTARLLGYEATTMGGASDWKDEYKNFFKNANLVLIPDRDKPGLALSSKMQESLVEVCKSLRVAVLTEGKDLTEWVESPGEHNLASLIDASPELAKYGGLPLPVITTLNDCYSFSWPGIGLVIKVDRLTDDYEGIILVQDKGKGIYVSNINLLAPRSMTELANRLSKTKKLNWDAILSQIALHCTERLSNIGEIVNINTDPENAQLEYLLEPILPLRKPTTLFAAGGKGKSTIADYWAVLVQFGICADGGLPFQSRQANVLILDWEADAETHKRYIKAIKTGLHVTDSTPIHYLFMEHPLVQVANSIRDYIQKYDIEFIIIDSQMAATATGNRGMTEAQIAGEYYNTLRSFNITSLTIDHVTKQGMNSDNSDTAPYGSVVKYNRSRSQFELRLPDDDDDADHKEYALIHKKFNLGRRLKPIGIAVDYLNQDNELKTITFKSLTISENPSLSKSSFSLKVRIIHALRELGKANASEIADHLAEQDKYDSIKTTLYRGSKGSNPVFLSFPDSYFGLLQ